MSHPFHGRDAAALYVGEERTRRRSQALLSAKTSGRNIDEVICAYADTTGLPDRPAIADIGCGQGRTTVRLARHMPSASITAIDASPAMANAARERTRGHRVTVITGDFHALPLRAASLDLAVAVMCLYHSPAPLLAIGEIARTLRPHGAAILVTKAADSYRELADLLTLSGLDPDAHQRPSLYENAHSGNLANLTEQGALRVETVEHETHTFTFDDLAHTASYLATCPQYQLPERLHHPHALAAELRTRLSDKPITTTATITYVLARAGQPTP
ncbi:class I SAM-dependent methyltransferase [Thermomonospora umbrina]|uniref:Methyltransferase family protein n=1 Tax=Thermomonospora umbrina TaxID=111806 RepID=A0A3D9SX52_9ACTN|nr:class I SAM-dependent methyltransferase [Thermomonospora umbrina]REF00527.1 methyltransferase family protein [Thermomonospora umbrina]